MISFNEYVRNILSEQLHPEIRTLITTKRPNGRNVKPLLVKKIKELTARGEKTGIEGNMPSGSSRAYIPIDEPHSITLDGAPAQIKTGMKVAIKATLDAHHKAHNYDGMSLGELQNRAEAGDYYTQKKYHILTKKEDGTYETNAEHGIFPPRIEEDENGHSWAHVGHAESMSKKNFRELTKTPEHPQGINHEDFVSALERHWDHGHGKYWKGPPEHEEKLDRALSHPLTQKFLEHQLEYNSPPHDYRQLKNLGIFNHPDGSKHIVARDHGFNDEVMNAYRDARNSQWAKERERYMYL